MKRESKCAMFKDKIQKFS